MTPGEYSSSKSAADEGQRLSTAGLRGGGGGGGGGREPALSFPHGADVYASGQQMPSTPPTIIDLAKQLDISATTVWRALNDSPRVSDKTRKRVLAAAKRMNYRPSLVAQTLLRGRTQTLGVVVPMIGNPVYAALVRAVEQVAFHHKYNIVLCDTDFQPSREREYLDLLARRRVEGVAIVPFAARGAEATGENVGAAYEQLVSLARQGTAVVAMQQEVPGQASFDAIVPDNRTAARDMTAHLIRLGHRRIGFLHGGMPDWHLPMRKRFDGYRLALDEAGIAFDESLVLQAGTFASVLTDDSNGDFHATKVSEYLTSASRPTAVFAPVDMLAIRVMEVARDRLKMRVPEDVAIAGFDDILAAAHTSPPLTTVRQPTARIGQRAAELLFERMRRPAGKATDEAPAPTSAPPQPVHERVACELIIRRSCGSSLGGSNTAN
jgi:DNA-binding LacI/PurR family transcriptional regulator